MRESLLLTLRALMRGRILILLLGAVGLIHWLMPGFVRSDGTVSGNLEMYIRAVPGFVAMVVQLAILCIACGMFAKEREEKRLALTLTRPVPAFSVAVGKWLGLSIVAAVTLAFSSALLLAFPPDKVGKLPPCRHHYAPSLPPPEVTASRMLLSYLQDPDTPEAIKKASKSAVLTLLTTKEQDRYDVVKPGDTMVWPYEIDALKNKMDAGEKLSLLVRFSTQFEMRTPVAGNICMGDYSATVSNNTQALIEIPFTRAGVAVKKESGINLTFSNTGKTTVMLRPRRDLEVLAPADSFAWNLLRAQLEILSLSMLLAAYGLFLSAALSRPVAVFTALASFAVVLMVPSVIVQFPDEFHAPLADRIGLALSRCVQTVTSSVSMPSPVSDLATGRAVEWMPMLRTVVGNSILLPCVLLALSAFIVRRKPLADGR